MNKALFLCLITLWVTLTLKGQQKCDCSILVNQEFKGRIKLVSKAKGSIKYLKHNLEEEDYLILHIIEESDSTFDVSAALAINGYVASGRVKKSDVLGVYSRAYSGKLVIHETPQKGSKKRLISIKGNEFLTVLSCRSKWVKVFFSSAGKGYVGWLPPEMQCDNPYSTCN